MPTYKAVTPLAAFDGFTSSGDFKRVAVEHLKMLDGLEYSELEVFGLYDDKMGSQLHIVR